MVIQAGSSSVSSRRRGFAGGGCEMDGALLQFAVQVGVRLKGQYRRSLPAIFQKAAAVPAIRPPRPFASVGDARANEDSCLSCGECGMTVHLQDAAGKTVRPKRATCRQLYEPFAFGKVKSEQCGEILIACRKLQTRRTRLFDLIHDLNAQRSNAANTQTAAEQRSGQESSRRAHRAGDRGITMVAPGCPAPCPINSAPQNASLPHTTIMLAFRQSGRLARSQPRFILRWPLTSPGI
jgi:hypothetical protein